MDTNQTKLKKLLKQANDAFKEFQKEMEKIQKKKRELTNKAVKQMDDKKIVNIKNKIKNA
ncbi:MAG: hypothetical protein AAB348_02480 [Patescibacteria group bacterium]